MSEEDSQEANGQLAFNQGCDARLAGLLPGMCPYSAASSNGRAWLAGWKHVAEHWGENARWPFRILPPLRGMRG
jgi:ribosome modulation factor